MLGRRRSLHLAIWTRGRAGFGQAAKAGPRCQAAESALWVVGASWALISRQCQSVGAVAAKAGCTFKLAPRRAGGPRVRTVRRG
eukprot:scaffold38851_cov35-Phaeocystis_antarctica.AAC.2